LNELYDIGIIGGSIAGLTAALYLASNDNKVILIEKKKCIGEPVNCGEITPSYLFEKYPELPMDNTCLANTITKLQITIEKSYEFTLKKYRAFVLNRDKLEQNIAKKAQDNGSEILTHCRFEDAEIDRTIKSVKTSKGRIRAKIFIDASGIASVLGKRLGLVSRYHTRNDVGICSQHVLETEVPQDIAKICYPKELKGQGYFWEFPKGEDKVNFGVGIILSSGLNPTKVLLDKCLRKRHRKYKIIKSINAPIPIEHPISPVHLGNTMLIGDAGRLVNPFTGGGIFNAVYSGYFSAFVANRFLTGQLDNLDSYSNRIIQVLYPNLKKSYRMKEAMINDRAFLKKFQRTVGFTLFLHRIIPKSIEKYSIARIHGG